MPDVWRQQNALLLIKEDYDYCAVAEVTSVYDYLFEAGKRYRDCTVNNVNHPNDFTARVYAQVILHTMFGEEYSNYEK